MALRARPPLYGISLCAGVGGIDLGLHLAMGEAYRSACFVEGEAYAASVLAARMEEGHLDPAPIWSDLRTFDASAWRGSLPGPLVVHGGYPCQPFSLAGRRKGKDDPRHLWPHVLRVLVESGASLGFFENVRGHVSQGLGDVLGQLACAGFSAEWDVFSAEEEGAPHRRERLFILAFNRHAAPLLGQGQLGSEPNGASSRRGPLADSDREGKPQPEGPHCEERGRAGDCCGESGALADPQGQRRESPRRACRAGAKKSRPADTGWWASEPPLGRVAPRVPDRVDRLRALGNAVVPAVAARAWLELTARAGLA